MHKRKNPARQRGMVSFMVTLIMMMVISLIVVGFTQVTIRTRREALDRQLSSQAFYAAESGVNRVVTVINSGGAVQDQRTCNGGQYAAPSLGGDVSVTCMLVDATPKRLVTSATQSRAKILKITPVDESTGNPQLIGNLTFTWSVAPNQVPATSGCAPKGSFKADGSGCTFALLRVDLMHITDALATRTNLTSDDFAARTTTLYFQPQAANSDPPLNLTPASVGGNPKGHIIAAVCSTSSRTCAARINFSGFSLSGNPTNFYARISSFYYDSNSVTVTTSNDTVRFVGSQAIIDVTGKAKDVLRRVQVSYSLSPQDDITPVPALQSGSDICKQIKIVTSGVTGTTTTSSDCP